MWHPLSKICGQPNLQKNAKPAFSRVTSPLTFPIDTSPLTVCTADDSPKSLISKVVYFQYWQICRCPLQVPDQSRTRDRTGPCYTGQNRTIPIQDRTGQDRIVLYRTEETRIGQGQEIQSCPIQLGNPGAIHICKLFFVHLSSYLTVSLCENTYLYGPRTLLYETRFQVLGVCPLCTLSFYVTAREHTSLYRFML